ncbi:hypothetical protein NBRC116601_04740 [Cognatishimia sp. WU-CL00825]|uniref:M23 family metallopeptidase n=1 Tax=Cognatishimia sp. WU-CL00825 TaxID=3127658 RepID=UPI003105D10C
MRIRIIALVGTVAVLASCLSDEKKFGYSVGYGRSYPEKIALKMPGNAPSITQQYRNTLDHGKVGDTSAHLGIDIHADIGTPVIAAADGVVLRSYWGPAYGNQIEILHAPDSSGKSSRTRYVHLDKRLVKVGAQVQRGGEIGHLGITGFLSSGFPHLHFEVLFRGTSIFGSATDPHKFWAKGPGQITCFGPEWNGLSTDEFKITYPVGCK